MKILYIGVNFDGTGYSQAANDYCLALDSVGVDVTIRPVRLSQNKNVSVPKRIKELYEKQCQKPDVVIQHMLPSMMEYDGRLLNVGLYANETSDFRMSGWAEKLNQMDHLIVPYRQGVSRGIASGVTKPISVIPHASNTERFQRTYGKFPVVSNLKEQGKFIFYTIGEGIRRKNIVALIQAFHAEFDPDEPVELVIKTSYPGKTPQEFYSQLMQSIEMIKGAMKLRKLDHYKKEILVLDRLKDEQLMSLHCACDCYVSPSYGEAWNQPAFDSMGFGKTPILSADGGHLDFCDESTGYLVGGRREPVFDVKETTPDIFTGHETWFSVDILDLRYQMRRAFNEEEERRKKSINGMKRVYDFSYEKVGHAFRNELQQWVEQKRNGQM